MSSHNSAEKYSHRHKTRNVKTLQKLLFQKQHVRRMFLARTVVPRKSRVPPVGSRLGRGWAASKLREKKGIWNGSNSV